MNTTLQDRLDVALERCGGNQSELARRVSELLGRDVPPQTIQKLCNREVAKPTRTSRLLPEIAKATGLSLMWLTTGEGPRDAVTSSDYSQSSYIPPSVKEQISDSATPPELEEVFEAIRLAWRRRSLDKAAILGLKTIVDRLAPAPDTVMASKEGSKRIKAVTAGLAEMAANRRPPVDDTDKNDKS